MIQTNTIRPILLFSIGIVLIGGLSKMNVDYQLRFATVDSIAEKQEVLFNPPVVHTATDDYGELSPCEDYSINIDVLENDVNPLEVPLAINLLGSGTQGTFQNNNDGTVTYTPNTGIWNDGDQVDYEICNDGLCSQATIFITNEEDDEIRIGGFVFADENENGLMDGDEEGELNIEVDLYEDVNGNGLVDGGDVFIETQNTGSNGSYRFGIESSPSSTNTITLTSSKSADHYEGNDDANYGSCSYMYIEEDGGYRCYSFIEFDLSSIPTDCNITSATLTVRNSNAVGGGDFFEVGVQRVAEYWDEGFGGCGGSWNGLTWENRTTSNEWAAEGGTFGPTVYDVEFAGAGHSDGTQYNFDVADLVSEWMSGTYPNYGLAVLPTAFDASGGYDYFAIYSDDTWITSYRPKLQVTYECSQTIDYVLEVDNQTIPVGATFTTDNVEAASFTALGQAECDNNFGYLPCPPVPDPGEDGSLIICAGSTVSSSQLFNTLGGSPEAGGTWSPSPGGAGTYIYTVGGSGDCPTASAQVVVANSSVEINNVEISSATCPNLNNGSIEIAATGNNLQYSIDGGATYQASNIFNGLSPGSYNVRVRNSSTLCFDSSTDELTGEICPELCDDGIDNDSDGLVDDEDPDCGVTCVATGIASQSSTGYGGVPSRAIDGNTSGTWSNGSVTHTNTESNPWWELDMGFSNKVYQIDIHNRTDCCSSRLNGVIVELLDGANTVVFSQTIPIASTVNILSVGGVDGEKIRVRLSGSNKILSLAEVVVHIECPDEICGDGIDNDGNGLTDCDDPECGVTLSVSKTDPTCANLNGGAITISATGNNLEYSIDGGATYQTPNVFTGLSSDSYDVRVRNSASLCFAEASGVVLIDPSPCSEICDNGIDDDNDGLTDCEDPDCVGVVGPILIDDTFTTCPGMPLTDYVDWNDSGLDNAIFIVTSQPSNSVVTIEPFTGKFTITPFSFDCATEQFNYQVCNALTDCCAEATVTIIFGDNEPPSLVNVPEDITIDCSDIVPDPNVVLGFDMCPGIYVDMDETTSQNQGGACDTYTITRTWTATDLCGNESTDQQIITVEDQTRPEIFQVYTLENGARVVAGVSKQVTHVWKHVRFPIAFDTPPLIFSQVVSENDASAVVCSKKNIHTQGFELKLTEEEGADGIHLEEEVAWFAIEQGENTGSFTFETSSLPGITNAQKSIDFSQVYESSPLFFSSIQTTNDPDPVSLRHLGLNQNNVKLFVQEEQSEDSEVAHSAESVAYMAIASDSPIEDERGQAFGEMGTISINHNWTTITTSRSYTKPVVIVGGLTRNGAQASTVRVRSVGENSFQVRVQEWDYLDGAHAMEQVSWMVLEGSIPSEGDFDCFDEAAHLQPGVNLFSVDNCDNQPFFDISEGKTVHDGVLVTTYNWMASDNCGNSASITLRDSCNVAALKVQTLLRGANLNSGNNGLMRDDLRQQNLIPLNEPFTKLPQFAHLDGSVPNGNVTSIQSASVPEGYESICFKPGTEAQKTMLIPEEALPYFLAKGALAGGCGTNDLPGLQTVNFRTIADGEWTDDAIWEGGIAPETDDIENKSIHIRHDVVVENSTIELDDESVLWVTEASLTFTTEGLQIKNASAHFYHSLLNITSSDEGIELDDENALLEMYESELIVGGKFKNEEGKRLLINTSLIVDEYIVEEDGEDGLFHVCASVTGEMKIEDEGYLFTQKSKIKIQDDFKNESSGVVAGSDLTIWVESGELDNMGTWTAGINQYCVNGSAGLPSEFLPSLENCDNISGNFSSCQYSVDDEFNFGAVNPSIVLDTSGINQGGTLRAELLEIEGEEAITDWVLIELRNAEDESEILSYSTSAVQRNGKVISEDGEEVIIFGNLPEGNYYVSVHHRNHLPIMTDMPVFLSSVNPPEIDFTDPTLDLFGGYAGAQYVDNERYMWAGDFNGDGQVIYQGPYNDVFTLFARVMIDEGNIENLANFIISGYDEEDINMDGKVIFQGPLNDKAPLLYHSILSHPLNSAYLANYIVNSYLP